MLFVNKLGCNFRIKKAQFWTNLLIKDSTANFFIYDYVVRIFY